VIAKTRVGGNFPVPNSNDYLLFYFLGRALEPKKKCSAGLIDAYLKFLGVEVPLVLRGCRWLADESRK